MSRVVHSSAADAVLRSKADVVDHLLAKVNAAKAGLTGIEQELFVTTATGHAPGFDAIERVLGHMGAAYQGAERIEEKGRLVGLILPGLGDVCLEPGGQVELSSAASPDLVTLETRQRDLYALLQDAADAEGLQVQGGGHHPLFKQADLVPRSRFAAYAAYCTDMHGDEKAQALLDTMKSCCGVQINVDPMGQDFHEIYRALLVVELAGCFRDLSPRHERFATTYAPLFPKQVTPMFNAVAARGNKPLVGLIVDRLLSLNVPFVPDPDSAEGFLPSASVYGVTPTVGDLMEKGVLTAELLDNCLSLQMTMPNLRRHGVVETRAPDTPKDMEEVMDVAARYHRATYDAPVRKALLSLPVKPALLEQAYAARFTMKRDDLMQMSLGGHTVASFIAEVDKLTAGTGPVAPASQLKH